MTKQEKIKEVYGLYWKDYGHLTDENGFIYQSDLFYPDTEMKKEGVEIEVISVEQKHKWSNVKWRPKSLSGIEDNNGWVKIESEHDLPKEVGIFWVNDSRYGGIGQAEWRSGKFVTRFNNIYQMEDITHYKPIVKPNPPIY